MCVNKCLAYIATFYMKVLHKTLQNNHRQKLYLTFGLMLVKQINEQNYSM